MQVSVSEGKAHLTELVRRAEAGAEVILTRHGRPAARLIAASAKPTSEDRQLLIDELQASVAAKNLPPIRAEFSQDFLYDERGLPA